LDPSRPVYIEAESSKIGRLIIPPTLWQAMIAAPNLRLTAPVAARADHLLTAYPDMRADPDKLDTILKKLIRYHGHEQVQAWQALATTQDFRTLAMQLIQTHYDPRYARISRAHAPDAQPIDLPDLSEASLVATAARIIALP
ncbi:MAG: tRNA 2-selenouridine(34) synthase MnmH, partial [Alphaproteobacteria bacterium]